MHCCGTLLRCYQYFGTRIMYNSQFKEPLVGSAITINYNSYALRIPHTLNSQIAFRYEIFNLARCCQPIWLTSVASDPYTKPIEITQYNAVNKFYHSNWMLSIYNKTTEQNNVSQCLNIYCWFGYKLSIYLIHSNLRAVTIVIKYEKMWARDGVYHMYLYAAESRKYRSHKPKYT